MGDIIVNVREITLTKKIKKYGGIFYEKATRSDDGSYDVLSSMFFWN